MSSGDAVKLRSKDGQEHDVRRVVALRIKFLQDMLEEDLEAGTVDVDVESSVLANVIAYYEWHTENSDASDSDKKAHDQTFLSNMKRSEMLETMIAANYLNAKELLDATVLFFGRLISNKDPDGIREALMIKTPFLPGEIEEAAAQNKWTFKLDAPPTPSGN